MVLLLGSKRLNKRFLVVTLIRIRHQLGYNHQFLMTKPRVLLDPGPNSSCLVNIPYLRSQRKEEITTLPRTTTYGLTTSCTRPFPALYSSNCPLIGSTSSNPSSVQNAVGLTTPASIQLGRTLQKGSACSPKFAFVFCTSVARHSGLVSWTFSSFTRCSVASRVGLSGASSAVASE